MKLNALMDAVEAAINARYPGEPVYRDMLPKDFRRPSFTMECQKVERTGVNIGLEQETVTLLVTCYAAVDAYNDSSREELNGRQESIQDIFAAGFLRVEDRRVWVQTDRGTGSPEAAEVTAVFTWMDVRPGYQDPENPGQGPGGAPMMEQFEVNVSRKE